MARYSLLCFLVAAVFCVAAMAPDTARAEDILEGLGGPGEAAPAPAEPAAKPSDPVADPVAVEPQAQPTKPVVVAPAALDRIKALPKKTLLKRHRFELSPFAAASLNDAFYQHLTAGGTAIFYPHDSFGVGIGADYFYSHLSTKNIDAVRENLIAVPAALEHPWLFVHLDAYFVPIYGKLSLFASDIINFDMYAVAGAGAALAGEHKRPAANIGIGNRLGIGQWLALRFELRDHLFVDTQTVNGVDRSDVQSYLMFMAGVSMFLPTSFEYTY